MMTLQQAPDRLRQRTVRHNAMHPEHSESNWLGLRLMGRLNEPSGTGNRIPRALKKLT